MPPIDDFEIDLGSKDMQFILDPDKNPILKQMVENGDVSFLASDLQKYVGMPNTPATWSAIQGAVADAFSQSLYALNSAPKMGKTNGLFHALHEQFKEKGLIPSFKDDIEQINEIYKTMPKKAETILDTKPNNKINYCDGLYFIRVEDEVHKDLENEINLVEIFIVKEMNYSLAINQTTGYGFDGKTFVFKSLKNKDNMFLVNLHYQKFKPLWFQKGDSFEKNKGEITWKEVMINKMNYMYGFNANKYIIHFTTTKGTSGYTDILTFLKSYELI